MGEDELGSSLVVALLVGHLLRNLVGTPADKHRTSGGHDFRECVRCQEIEDPVHRVAGTGDEAVKRHRPVHDHLASVGAHIRRSFAESWGPGLNHTSGAVGSVRARLSAARGDAGGSRLTNSSRLAGSGGASATRAEEERTGNRAHAYRATT